MRVLAIEATIASGIAQGVEDLNVAIETAADEAFGVELVNMRDLHQMGMDICQETAPREKIKAKLGATAIAQDILDRAGKRAPTRVVQTNLSGKIPQEALDRMVAVMEENHDRTIEVRGSSTPAATSRDESGS
jgi:predicted metal-dependent phosphoesterase TrpH